MKKTISLFFTLALLTLCLSKTFAKITFDHSIAPDFPAYNQPYTAKIMGADYYYTDGKPMVAISLYNPPSVNVYLEFSEGDLPFAMAIASSVGKSLTLYFANANYDVEELRIENTWISLRDKPNGLAMPRFTLKQ